MIAKQVRQELESRRYTTAKIPKTLLLRAKHLASLQGMITYRFLEKVLEGAIAAEEAKIEQNSS